MRVFVSLSFGVTDQLCDVNEFQFVHPPPPPLREVSLRPMATTASPQSPTHKDSSHNGHQSHLQDPSFILRSLDSLLELDADMTLSSTSCQDATDLISVQVLFIAGAAISSIRGTPVMSAYPLPGADVIGVIGCGLLGSTIVRSLLKSGWPPSSIMICSRDQQKLEPFRSAGCNICTDVAIASTAKVIVLTCAPQHLRSLGNLMKKVGNHAGSAAAATAGEQKPVVVSTVAGAPAMKIGKMLGFTNVVRTFVDVDSLPLLCKSKSTSSGARAGGESQSEQQQRRRQQQQQQPVTKGHEDDDDNDNSEEAAVSVAAARSFIKLEGGLAYLQGAVETLTRAMGVDGDAALKRTVRDLLGEGRDRAVVPKDRLDSEGGGTATAETENDGLEAPIKYWEQHIAPHFYKVFATEVFARDLPSLAADKEQEEEWDGN